MRIEQVISKDKAVSIQIRDDENEFSRLTTVSVSVEYGALLIRATVDNKEITLMQNGQAVMRPYDRSKMNSIESELENALRLFRIVAHEDE